VSTRSANRRWVLDGDSGEKFEVISWAALPSFTCPHCGKDTEHPPALLFDTLMMSRATCRYCNQDFLIVDDYQSTNDAE
jgi:hypothetical protein